MGALGFCKSPLCKHVFCLSPVSTTPKIHTCSYMEKGSGLSHLLRRTKNEVNNYSMTPILCKYLEHIICSDIWNHIEHNELLSDGQHGFRKGYSTTIQLLHVVHHATEALDKKDDYQIISFDFAEAFDRVPHNLLILKLRGYKFNSLICDWIHLQLGKESAVNSTHINNVLIP